ncbi:HD domain-containing protein [Streptomyces halobius]|uniref:HD domain-containing protein n=1 Tax=Streptomyces halobius TaxID=2879846 RepID=A0ABY4M2F0_9ACTN|nr:HD domain-containing protein [Streptomyces halobius]UQA91868.1 HD domain-containing protein [Streptomyces halobius]
MDGTDVVETPDSALARETAALLRASAPEVLVNHCQRSFQFGWTLGERRGWRPDRELLYLGAVLHDLGLTERFDGPRAFELEGAAAAEAFLRERGCSAERAGVVKDAVALHLDVEAAQADPRPEVRLVSMGSGLDTHGARAGELPPGFLDTVVRAWPRLGFRDWLRRQSHAQAERKPDSKVAWWVETGRMGENIGNPPFPE